MLNFSDVQQSGYAGSNGNIGQDPLLVNQDGYDFHLEFSSPCIDAGSNTPPFLLSSDYEGDARLIGPSVDMGADERQTGQIPGVVVYKHREYGGYWAVLGAGDYTLADLQSLGVLDNDLSSVRVPYGYKIIFYDGDNFSGETLVRATDDHRMSLAGW